MLADLIGPTAGTYSAKSLFGTKFNDSVSWNLKLVSCFVALDCDGLTANSLTDLLWKCLLLLDEVFFLGLSANTILLALLVSWWKNITWFWSFTGTLALVVETDLAVDLIDFGWLILWTVAGAVKHFWSCSFGSWLSLIGWWFSCWKGWK